MPAARRVQTATVRLAIRVKPGSSRPRVGGRHGDALIVAVASQPVEGAATAAAIGAVASAFGVSRRAVTVVTGSTSRSKVVDVEASDEAHAARLMSRLSELLDGP